MKDTKAPVAMSAPKAGKPPIKPATKLSSKSASTPKQPTSTGKAHKPQYL